VSIADTCRTEGQLAEVQTSRELVLYAGRKVAAIVNDNPMQFVMEDAGFNSRSPVTIEVFKGDRGSTKTISIDGVIVPLDLRGVVPKKLDPVLYNNAGYEVSEIHNAGEAWLITTIKSN
jgi:hypothetical protein